MKRFVLLLMAFTALPFFAAAQSLDKTLEQLEFVRLQKGEQSEAYLSALDSVILKANISGEKAMALAYRQQHLDIVKQMKGERCVVVADDLWRLGNTSRMLGDTIRSHDYYKQAAGIFDENYRLQIDSVYASHYCSCLFAIIERCAALSEIDGITYYSPQLERVICQVYITNYCQFSYSLTLLTLYNAYAQNVDNVTKYCKLIVDNCKSIDSCNFLYVSESYKWLKTYYHDHDQKNEVIYALDYVDKLENTKNLVWQGSFLEEKIDAFLWVLACDLNNMEEGYAYGKRAEKLYLDSHGSEVDFMRDQLYYRICFALAWNRYKVNDYVQAKSYMSICRVFLEQNGQKYSKEYYLAIYMLFNCAIESGEMYLLESLASEMEPLIFDFSESPVEDAYHVAMSMYGAYYRLGRYDDAMQRCEESFELGKQLDLMEPWLNEANTAFGKAQILGKTGRKQDALSIIVEGYKALATATRNTSSLFVRSQLLSLESTLVMDYEEALAKNDSALIIMNNLIAEQIDAGSPNLKLLRSMQESYCVGLSNRSVLLLYHGAVAEGYAYMQKCSTMVEAVYSKNSSLYISCQNNIALFQMSMGQYANAIQTLNELGPLIKSSIGEKTPSYANYLSNCAQYYFMLGHSDLSLEYLQQSAEVLKEIGDLSDYAIAIANVGSNLVNNDKPNEARKCLEEALDIFESDEALGTILGKVYQSLSKVSFRLGDLESGSLYYDKARHLIESTYGKQSVDYAELLLIHGVEMCRQKNESAFDIFSDAVEIMRSIGMVNHHNYIRSLLLYGMTGIEFNKPIEKDYSQMIVEAVKQYYDAEMKYYSNADREFLWNWLFETKDLLFSSKYDADSEECLFDYALFSKALMLSTSDYFKECVYQSGDKTLITQYEGILTLQRIIDNQSFINMQSGVSVEDMRDNLVAMERDLIGKMMESGAYTIERDITYQDVAGALKPKEIAVEFVDYYHLKDQKTYYVALMAKSSWDKPVYVQLCTEDELKACLGNPNVTYSTDDLYRLLWQPLAEYIDEGDKVYFSPSGMLHTIALESLHTPDGSCLSDKYDLVRLTSTRELCKERQPKTYETGAVYGGLQYDVDQQRMAEVSAMNKTAAEESLVFALRGEDRGNWNYLQGTKDEVEHIAGIMRQANIGCELFEGDLGNEESFKALSGSNTDIIHLATHGYFIEGEKADVNDFMQSLSPLARQKTDSVIDPLLRSGLILSGGNRAWLGQEVPEGIEDGVLTALEISTMNLSGTDMVVMSACETGLGDITSDGVFGLQRAFKMAGVQTLVMSLWKVDDNATSLMMQTFYEHLLSGMSKREAFNLAQAAVRAKYPEPYYWAGFVMLD